MQLLYFIFLIFVLLTVFAIFMGARSMEKKRKQEFISSPGFKEIITFLSREEITLQDFDKEIV